MPTTTAELTAALEAQDALCPLPPGTPGWWRIWGARPCDIRPGDAVCDDSAEGFWLCQDVYLAKNSPLRCGVVIDGARVSLGALSPVVVLRYGTHHTLVPG